MSEKYYVSWKEIFKRLFVIDSPENTVYGIPKGGMIAAGFLKQAKITENPIHANIILDDLVDSGATRDRFMKAYPEKEFHALFDKQQGDENLGWLVFPWELHEVPAEDAVVRQLEYMGEDLSRNGLKETPKRVVKAWDELFFGYKQDPEEIFKQFDGDGIGGLVYLKDIEFFSMCEHHLLPFYGSAHIGYIPNGKIIGISKLARLLDIYARRAQVQERIAEQVTDDIMKYLNPLGAACIIEAKHLCIACRGVRKQHSIMGYSSMKGVFMENTHNGNAARQEFINLVSK